MGFLSTRERRLKIQKRLLKDHTLYSVCSHLHWAPAEVGQSGVEMPEESLGLLALGRELKSQASRSLRWVILHTTGTIFLRQSTPLQMASARGEAISPHTGITLPNPIELKPSYWEVELEDFHWLTWQKACRQRWNSGYSVALADPPWGPVLLRAGLRSRPWSLILSAQKQAQQREPHTVDHW